MAGSGDRSALQFALALVLLQAGAVALATGIAALVDARAVQAALTGGLVGLAANGYFALVSLRPLNAVGAARGPAIARNFYAAAAGKYLIVIVGLVGAFAQLPSLREDHHALVLLAALLLVQCAYWATPLLIKKGD